MQVTTTYEPQSSGWHRAKRPGAWTVGLGSGLGIGQGFMPLVRFELGASYVTSSLLFSIESGSRKTSDFDVANVATALEIQQFLGNSFYLSLGFVTENLVGSFTPIKSYDGILKQTDEYSGRYSSSVKGIEIGFGNRWQWGGFSLATEWVGYRGAMTRNDDIKLVSITPEAIPDATIALNKNYITDKTPANLRILMTRFLYSF
ncbi:hypothetical protein EBU99_14385 [bacterium]|nr:hypothetical protein [bacterium]